MSKITALVRVQIFSLLLASSSILLHSSSWLKVPLIMNMTVKGKTYLNSSLVVSCGTHSFIKFSGKFDQSKILLDKNRKFNKNQVLFQNRHNCWNKRGFKIAGWKTRLLETTSYFSKVTLCQIVAVYEYSLPWGIPLFITSIKTISLLRFPFH